MNILILKALLLDITNNNNNNNNNSSSSSSNNAINLFKEVKNISLNKIIIKDNEHSFVCYS